MSTFLFLSDPSHGWLRVPAGACAKLGIADRISRCSYSSARYDYLEEDCDAGVFVRAWEAANGTKITVRAQYVNSPSSVRRKASYGEERT